MAWRDDAAVDRWLRGVTPRLTRTDIDQHRKALADIRARGYGAWRFDDAHASLHERAAATLHRWSRLPRWRDSRPHALALDELNTALENAQSELTPGVADGSG